MIRILFALSLFVFAGSAMAADKKEKTLISMFGKDATPESLFTKLDADKDGKLTTDELKKLADTTKKPEKFKGDTIIPFILEKLDADKDKVLSAEEFKKLTDLKMPTK